MYDACLRHAMTAYVMVCWWPCLVDAETQPETPTEIVPDPSVQARIDELVKESQTAGEIDRKKVLDAVKELRKSFPNQSGRLILQLVAYGETVKDERFMWTTVFFLKELGPDLRRRETMLAVAPYLSVENRSVRIELFQLMDRFCCNGGPKTDYGRIFTLMQAKKGEIPDGLIRYMFETAPGKALLVYARFFSTRSGYVLFLMAEYEVSETLWMHENGLLDSNVVEPAASRQLSRLSRHDSWWARLYVAEIMRQHGGFRQEELVERLQQDKHPLVRKTIEAFAKNAGHE